MTVKSRIGSFLKPNILSVSIYYFFVVVFIVPLFASLFLPFGNSDAAIFSYLGPLLVLYPFKLLGIPVFHYEVLAGPNALGVVILIGIFIFSPMVISFLIKDPIRRSKIAKGVFIISSLYGVYCVLSGLY